MADSMNTSYREILQNQSISLRNREITVTTGSIPGTKWENSSTSRAGGYGYHDSARVGGACRNRFIYWRSNNDTLELTEVSLDFNLSANAVRFRFQDAPLVGNVSIHESHGNVVVMVTTICSVHRLLFPHPSRLQQRDQAFLPGTDCTLPSIFTDASVVRAQDPAHSHNLNQSGQTHTPVATATWLGSDGHAMFAVSTSSGSVLLVRLPPLGMQGIVSQVELKHSSVMQRLWTGLVPQLIRGGASEGDISQALLLHPLATDTYLFALGRDLKLRMWSCKNAECIMAADMMEHMPDSMGSRDFVSMGGNHLLRKCVTSTSQSLHLGVFITFPDRCQFCVFHPIMVDGRYQLNHVTTVFGLQDELVDFSMTPGKLWTLWNTTQGDTVIKMANITVGERDSWSTVHMEPALATHLEVPAHLDPRQAHMDHIFSPGLFTTQAILKALNIYRRALDTTHMPDTAVPMDALRKEVSSVVEYEIQRGASEYELSQEEFHQLQSQQWARFYSCLVQYHHRGNQALGLLADGNTGMVVTIRKESVSYVRPSQTTEHLYMGPQGACLPQHIQALAHLTEDGPLCEDLVRMANSLRLMRDALSPTAVYFFEQDLFHKQSPVELANTVISGLLTDPNQRDQLWGVCDLGLTSVGDIVQAAEAMIHLLDLAQNPLEQSGLMEDDRGYEVSRQLGVSHLFSSSGGISLVCKGVQQLAHSRLEMSRDLLFTLTLMLHMGEQASVSLAASERIKCDLLPRTATLVQAYFLLSWASDTSTTAVSSAHRESRLRQLEILGLTSDTTSPPHSGESSLLELFLRGSGGDKVREELQHYAMFEEDQCAVWTEGLVPMVTSVAQLLWPYSSFLFPQFLVQQCQWGAVQEYTRLADWCELNGASRRFLLALSHLNCSEAHKAYEGFLEATHGVSHEDFLLAVLQPPQQRGLQVANAEVLYYLKVLTLLELFAQPPLVVNLAKTAISIADKDDPNVATLWSKVFKHELEMGHNEAAYNAMLANPDASRRKDCLREFLVVLCERSQLQTLVELPYRDRHVVLEDEVVSILESRARAIDLTQHNYYHLLYAFHVFRSNYRKAGSIMYEYGMRLGREVAGLKGLQQQAKCYLAALNALRLVEDKYAWIIKPLTQHTQVDSEQTDSSGKHSLDGDEIPTPVKRRIEVLELADIEREYMLVHARLQLLKQDPDPAHMAGPTASAEETLGLLVNAGLMDSAVNICRMFDLPLTPVFEGLASRCAQLAENSESFMQGDNDYTAQAWSWLQLNTLPPANATRHAGSGEHAWRMLHSYLQRYGNNSSTYYRCVTARFLSQGFPLPDWLIAGYKKVNSAELLRLYLDYDQLEEAAHLTLELIDSVCGRGKEYFGLKTYLHATAPAVWLPYTAIDQLLIALRDVETEPHYSQLYRQLSERLDRYFSVVEGVSEDAQRLMVQEMSSVGGR